MWQTVYVLVRMRDPICHATFYMYGLQRGEQRTAGHKKPYQAKRKPRHAYKRKEHHKTVHQVAWQDTKTRCVKTKLAFGRATDIYSTAHWV